MTRKIKASEVREGMEVEWTSRGWHHRGEVATVKRNDHVGVWLQSSDGFEMSVEPDQAITVLSEPQPDEPTAFGARVVVDGRRFLRAPESRVDSQSWLEENEGKWRFWDDLLRMGPVMVIPDQGWTDLASAEPREPRVWDRWEDVPEMTPVRVSGIETPYRKVGYRIECKPGKAWVPATADEYDLNKDSPFTEARDA